MVIFLLGCNCLFWRDQAESWFSVCWKEITAVFQCYGAGNPYLPLLPLLFSLLVTEALLSSSVDKCEGLAPQNYFFCVYELNKKDVLPMINFSLVSTVHAWTSLDLSAQRNWSSNLWADTSPCSAVESGFKSKSSIFISSLFPTDNLDSIIVLNDSHEFCISLSSWDIWHAFSSPLPENIFFKILMQCSINPVVTHFMPASLQVFPMFYSN